MILAWPAEAHCYRVWHYPKPQRCFTVEAVFHVKHDVETFRERLEIPLPALDWAECPEGDERLEAVAKLRSLMDGR